MRPRKKKKEKQCQSHTPLCQNLIIARKSITKQSFCWWKPTGKNEHSAKRQLMEHNKNSKDTKQAAVQPKPHDSKKSFNYEGHVPDIGNRQTRGNTMTQTTKTPKTVLFDISRQFQGNFSGD